MRVRVGVVVLIHTPWRAAQVLLRRAFAVMLINANAHDYLAAIGQQNLAGGK
jgi:hypothetical protein